MEEMWYQRETFWKGERWATLYSTLRDPRGKPCQFRSGWCTHYSPPSLERVRVVVWCEEKQNQRPSGVPAGWGGLGQIEMKTTGCGYLYLFPNTQRNIYAQKSLNWSQRSYLNILKEVFIRPPKYKRAILCNGTAFFLWDALFQPVIQDGNHTLLPET